MIDIKNISFAYDNNIVIDNLCASINENTSIIGKSGCGKTTLLHLISRILKPSKGSITINNDSNDSFRNSIGLVMQKGGVFPYKTIYENLALGLQIKKDEHIKDKVIAMAKKLGLEDKLDKFPKQLSGGQIQRTSLGRILCLKPQILLLDEPFSSLDEITRQNLQDEIIQISMDEKILVVTVTHSIQEAVILGNKVLAMGSTGRIEKEYNTKSFSSRDINYYNMCINIDKEIRRILI